MGWLGIIFFICIGTFVGILINSFQLAKGKILRQNFVAMGTLAGKSLGEIETKVGEPSAISGCKVSNTGKPGKLCTWTKRPYSITLLFDENNICIGVNREITGK